MKDECLVTIKIVLVCHSEQRRTCEPFQGKTCILLMKLSKLFLDMHLQNIKNIHLNLQVSGAGKSSSSPAGQPRTTNVLDSMTMSSRKPATLSGTSKQGKAPVLKPLAPKSKSKVQCVAQIQMFSIPVGSHNLSDPIKLTFSSICKG